MTKVKEHSLFHRLFIIYLTCVC